MPNATFKNTSGTEGQSSAVNGTADYATTVPADGGKFDAAAEEHIPQRIREIAMWRGLGFSFRQIGAEFGITPQAVSLMLSRHRRAAKSLRPDSELQGLSARAVNVLGRHSIRTRDDARARNILAILPLQRNCGRKTAEEIERWLAAETD